MPYFELSHTAEEVDELLSKVKAGACLPVVGLTSNPGSDMNPAILKEEEVALMDAAEATGMPIVVKFTYSGSEQAIVMSRAALPMEDIVMYAGIFTDGSYVLYRSGSMWVFMMHENSASGNGLPEQELCTEIRPGDDIALDAEDIEFFEGLEGGLCRISFWYRDYYYICMPEVSIHESGNICYDHVGVDYTLRVCKEEGTWWCYMSIPDSDVE